MELTEAGIAEIVQLGAINSGLFYKTFFPESFRTEIPDFHNEIDGLLDSTDRYVSLEVFRGGAKTTKLRAFAAKRIALGISKTVLYVGKSQDHARASLQWFRNQVERKDGLYARAFGLRPGIKWTDEELQVVNEANGSTAWMLARGITGSIRGINYDDYRPDLIIIDDVVDEENSSTPEQRKKIRELVHGALKGSLAPRSEAPFAKMVILQTPQDFEDISQEAKKDPSFVTASFACWTESTKDLPIDKRESIWPQRWTSEEFRKEYLSHAATNTLSIFAREFECKLITPERATFRQEWLQYFGDGEDEPEPAMGDVWCEMVIDPVPPPSDKSVEKGLNDKDYEALSVIGRSKGKIYVLETSFNRGHDPNWTIGEFFRLAQKWRVRKIHIEAVAYQRTLMWLLKEAMRRAGIYYLIHPYDDKQQKHHRIVNGIIGVASNRQLYVRREQHELITQFIHYPDIKYKDVLETVAIGCMALQDSGFNVAADIVEDESAIEELRYVGGCP